MYLKDPDLGIVRGVEAKQNVTIPYVYDDLNDTNFEPQFVRFRTPNTSTFYQGNVGPELSANPVALIELNGQSIFNGAKRLYMSNVVIDESTIDTINDSNNVLRFNWLGSDFTITFRNMRITSRVDLYNYLNNSGNYTVSPPSGWNIEANYAEGNTYNSNTLSISLLNPGPSAELVTFDLNSPFFKSPMWNAFSLNGNPTVMIYVNSKYIPCYYWDFRSILLNKYNKNFNRASNNSISTLFRYYFIPPQQNVSTYSANWNKESITSFDLGAVDENEIPISKYSWKGQPFIALELVGEQ